VSAVWFAGDKRATADVFRICAIPAPLTRPADEAAVDTVGFPAVLKPAHAYRKLLPAMRAELPSDQLILQRYVSGTPASVSFLVGHHGIVPLVPCEQLLSADGRFRYLGGRVPLAPPLARRALDLGRRAVAAVPGLFVYWRG
jgi:predicted ATP-grasp superfamily ATP-dependent carboligase